MADMDEDPYAVSSDSDDDLKAASYKKPPPKISIVGRSATDLKQIVSQKYIFHFKLFFVIVKTAYNLLFNIFLSVEFLFNKNVIILTNVYFYFGS